MKHRFQSFAARGLECQLVRVEVDHYSGHPGLVIVGLGDTAVQESRERVRAALKNSGFRFPRGRVVVNLAPADIPKTGPCFDLSIALGLVGVHESFSDEYLSQSAFFGELALDGALRHVDGILGLVSGAQKAGFKRVFVPEVNKSEAALVDGIEVYGTSHLQDLVNGLKNPGSLSAEQPEHTQRKTASLLKPLIDLSEIKGQDFAKRGLEISAAGAHNFLMSGSPGSGKTLLAKAMKGILPHMTLEESLEVTSLYSISGLLPEGQSLVQERPFRVVHHTASGTSLVGGGRLPKPGEISLAHRGVLFLDELAEFSQHTLDLLRQPLEDRQITISRASGSLTYPAHFILCAAMNPCPCGYFEVPKAKRECHCSPMMIKRYRSKLSGPFLDRIDLYCTVSPIDHQELSSHSMAEDSSKVLERVTKARECQTERFKTHNITTNSEMSPQQIEKYCALGTAEKSILSSAMDRLQLSARSYHRLLKTSRTIADLESSEKITSEHILEALQYRVLTNCLSA